MIYQRSAPLIKSTNPIFQRGDEVSEYSSFSAFTSGMREVFLFTFDIIADFFCFPFFAFFAFFASAVTCIENFDTWSEVVPHL